MSNAADSFREELAALLRDPRMPRSIRLCDANEASEIVSRAHRLFVIDSPRAWWMALRFPAATFAYPNGDAIEHLVEHSLGGDCPCWLIFETEDDREPVLDLQLSDAQRVLKELRYIEYHVLPKDLSWLMAESDHNVLYVSRATSQT